MVFNARNYVYSNLCIGVMGFNSLDSLYNIRCIISIKGTTNDVCVCVCASDRGKDDEERMKIYLLR